MPLDPTTASQAGRWTIKVGVQMGQNGKVGAQRWKIAGQRSERGGARPKERNCTGFQVGLRGSGRAEG